MCVFVFVCVCVCVCVRKLKFFFSYLQSYNTAIFLLIRSWLEDVLWIDVQQNRRKEKEKYAETLSTLIWSFIVDPEIHFTNSCPSKHDDWISSCFRSHKIVLITINRSTLGVRLVSEHVTRCLQKFDSRDWRHEIWREFFYVSGVLTLELLL